MIMIIKLLILGYLSGVTASSYGLGGLISFSVPSSEAVFANPALLPDSRGSFALGVRQNYFMVELTDFHTALSTSYRNIGFGFGLHKTGIKDVVSEYLFLTGVRYRISRVSFGLNTRVFYLRDLEDNNLSRAAFSMDLGLHTMLSIFQFSLSYLNVLKPSIGLIDRSEKSASELVFITAFKIPEPVTWLLGFDWTNSGFNYRLGSELWFTKGFGLRLGILEREIRMGLALKADKYGVDISFGSSRELGTSYVITTHYRL
jgi:hypothetical protein